MEKRDRRRKYKSSITFEIIGMIAACIILFAAIYSYVSFSIFNDVIQGQMETQIENTCFIARDCVNGDMFDDYLESKGTDEASTYALQLMQKVCNDTKFNYLYVIRPDFENKKVINSLSVHGEMYKDLETYTVGEITDVTDPDYDEAYRQIMNDEREIAFVYRLDMPYSDREKDHITGLTAIKNSNGDVVGIMCAEMTFAWYKEAFRFYRINAIKWLAIILLGGIIICSLLIRFRVVNPFIAITKETDRFARTNRLGETSIADEIRRNNELGLLAASVEQMENQTIQHIDNITQMTTDRERLKAEFDIAAKIQIGALPHEFPPFPDRHEFQLFASMDPAKEVGGDFYDFFMIDPDHLALVIADVSGKGVPAALFMMISKIMIDNYSAITMDPVKIVEMVNNKLSENNEAEMFVTVWLGILEISTGKLQTVNAGHEDPAMMKKNGHFALTREKHGFVVGGMEGMRYKMQEYKLAPGDTIFIYTDGVPEATNADNELYGTGRMVHALNTCKDNDNLEDIAKHVRSDIDSFVKDAPQFDDLTMLILRYYGNEGKN